MIARLLGSGEEIDGISLRHDASSHAEVETAAKRMKGRQEASSVEIIEAQYL